MLGLPGENNNSEHTFQAIWIECSFDQMGEIGEREEKPSIELKPIESEQTTNQVHSMLAHTNTHTNTINFIADAITNWIDDDDDDEGKKSTLIALWLNVKR